MSRATKPKKLTKEAFDLAIMEYIRDGILALGHVETSHFIKLMNTLVPEYKVMCKKTLITRMESLFVKGQEKLSSVFAQVEWVSTTADCWSARNKSFLGTSTHWIDPVTYKRMSACLGIRRLWGSHTFNVLANKLEQIHAQFGIEEKTVMTITDSGSNFLKAFNHFGGDILELQQTEDDEQDQLPFVIEDVDSIWTGGATEADEENFKLPPHSKCAVHLLNLVATADAKLALLDNDFKTRSTSALGKLQSLFNKQGRSPLSSEKIKEQLGVLFVLPNQTRWNSWFDAIRHVKNLITKGPEIKKNMKALCEILKVPVFTKTDYIFISEYPTVLQPIAFALDILQGEDGIAAGNLLPTLVVVKKELRDLKDQELEVMLPLVTAIANGVEKRFDHFFKLEFFQLAAVLHPQFKLTWLGNTGEDSKLKKKLTSKLGKQLEELSNDASSKSALKATTPDDPKDFYSSLKTINSSSTESPSIHPSSVELTQYFAAKTTTNWSCLDGFPNLKTLSLKYNAPLPSSASVERIFSLGGRVFTPSRTRLTDEHFEMIVFLKFNQKLLDSIP